MQHYRPAGRRADLVKPTSSPQGLDSVRKLLDSILEIAWRRWKRAKEHIELGGGVKLHDARVYLAGDPRDKQHEMIRGLEKALADGKLVDGCHVSLVAAYRTMIERQLGHGVGENKILWVASARTLLPKTALSGIG